MSLNKQAKTPINMPLRINDKKHHIKTLDKPMSKSSEQSLAMAGKSEGPKPTHFLARGENQYTPLIALDELPAWISIHGLPLYISSEDLLKWKATACFPAATKHAEPYKVLMSASGRNDGEASSDESDNVPSTRAVNARLSRAPGNQGRNREFGIKESLVLAHGNTAGGAGGQRYNPTTPGVLGRKVFCTHWMRTGECDFTQQGCMFVHRMPDLDTLEVLGFRSYPRWFREMPRDYQLDNSNQFDEAGLDQGHRHNIPSGAGAHKVEGQSCYEQERALHGRDYGKDHAIAYGHDNGREYGRNYEREHGRDRQYGGYSPPLGHYRGFNPLRGGPQAQPYSYGPSPWDGPSHGAAPHQRIWSVNTASTSANNPQQHGIPYGRPFVPHTAAPHNQATTRDDQGPSPTVATPVESPQVSPDYNHSFFSRATSPTTTLNRTHRALSPSPPESRQATNSPEATGRPSRRPLNDGVPPSPEQTYVKRFQGAKPKVFSAPDARVSGPPKPPALSESTHALVPGIQRGRARHFAASPRGALRVSQHVPHTAASNRGPKEATSSGVAVKNEDQWDALEPLMDVRSNPDRK